MDHQDTSSPPLMDAWDKHRTARARVLAGGLLLLGSLGLLLVVGCFLIGALVILRPQLVDAQIAPLPLSSEMLVLLGILYAVAGACGLAALVLGFLGARGLWLVLHERNLSQTLPDEPARVERHP